MSISDKKLLPVFRENWKWCSYALISHSETCRGFPGVSLKTWSNFFKITKQRSWCPQRSQVIVHCLCRPQRSLQRWLQHSSGYLQRVQLSPSPSGLNYLQILKFVCPESVDFTDPPIESLFILRSLWILRSLKILVYCIQVKNKSALTSHAPRWEQASCFLIFSSCLQRQVWN